MPVPLSTLFYHLEESLAAARAARWAALDPTDPDAALIEFKPFADALRAAQAALAALRPLLPPDAADAPADADTLATLRAWAADGGGGGSAHQVARTPAQGLRPYTPAQRPAPVAGAVGADAPGGLPADSTGPWPLNADFTNTQPVAFRWQTGTYLLGSLIGPRKFRAIYEWVLRWLFQTDPDRLRALVGTPEFDSAHQQRPDLATVPERLYAPISIAPDLFAEANRSPAEMAHRLRQLLRHYQLPPDTLVLWVRPTNGA